MVLLSIKFAFFVLVLLAIYYLLPNKVRWMVLLVGSVIFYISACNIQLFAVMLLPIAITYGAAWYIEKTNSQNKANVAVTVAIITDIIVLVIFKELNFFTVNLNLISKILKADFHISLITVIAPIGISYCILMLISYVLDVKWGVITAQKNFGKFLLYTIYFPIMTSGPITRYREVKERLFAGNHFNYDRFCMGLQRILWGLFKKLVIAERLAAVVNCVYTDFYAYEGLTILIGVLGYTVQVYCDFSACVDIVLGVSDLFGIPLPENFNTPFFAVSLSEIWRRWHMTLGFWMKDYVLYPILKSDRMQNLGMFTRRKFGKKYGKQIPTWIGMFFVWFSVGFWHGGTWKFIFGSGLFFFFMIVSGQILEPLFARIKSVLRINTDCFSWRLFQRIRTFLLFSFSISVGRADSLRSGIALLRRIFLKFNPWILFDNTLVNLGLNLQNWIVLLIGLFIVLLVSNVKQKGSIREWIAKQNIVFRWFLWIALAMSTVIFGLYGVGYDVSTFVYAAF